MKIQRNRIRFISGAEKYACRSLLVSQNTAVLVSETSEEEERSSSIMESIARKRRKLGEETVKYIDASFICGSAAKVERLWSQATYILQNHRKASTPMLAEAILFFKTNKSYWDLSTVCEAMATRQMSKKTKILVDLKKYCLYPGRSTCGSLD